jgi:hypothetical protein
MQFHPKYLPTHVYQNLYACLLLMCIKQFIQTIIYTFVRYIKEHVQTSENCAVHWLAMVSGGFGE